MKKIVIALLLVAAVIGVSSCELIGSLFDPDYVGTWELELPDDDDWIKIIMEFEKEAFVYVYQEKIDGDWVSWTMVKGTIEVDGDYMTMTSTHTKAVIDSETYEMGEWTAYNVEAVSPNTVTWAVDGDKLTITYENGNVTVLTKK